MDINYILNNRVAKSFLNWSERHTNNLSCGFYPARGSTGFTEQNLIHNYVISLIECLDDGECFHWFEFPWEDKKQHVDAIVYSPKYCSIFYIEAKRFNVESKKDSLAKDIKRIIKCNRSFIREHTKHKVNYEFVIVLSDVWLETKWKKAIPSWWMENKVPSQVVKWEQSVEQKLGNNEGSFSELLASPKYGVDWSPSAHYIYWLGEKIDEAKNYCILMGSMQIK